MSVPTAMSLSSILNRSKSELLSSCFAVRQVSGSRVSPSSLWYPLRSVFVSPFAKTDLEIKGTRSNRSPDLTTLQLFKILNLNDLESRYKDSDPIFYTRDLVSERRELFACLSCYLKFTDWKQMCFCQFCRLANCKDCLKKSRAFYEDKLHRCFSAKF
jgi:hypothetical protein